VAMRRTLSIVVFAVYLPLVACAGATSPASEGPRTHPARLVGTWQGSAWQVGAGKTQGDANVTITFGSDGAWNASTPSGTSSGTGWLAGDRVVLEGVAPDGAKIRYTRKERGGAGGHELWDMVEASFGAALVSLNRNP
jgi:hypothetical protein